MNDQTKWSDLLKAAVTEPGLILRAYSEFYGYSIGNQLAALIQCQQRGISPGPINTYQGWQTLNRQVKKGEKAIWLCMPLTRKVTDEQTGESATVATNFVWKPRWFVLGQTEGERVPMPVTPDWDKAGALAKLNIEEVEFELLDGNTMGYASKRQVAVSPLCPLPHKTLFHEMAHVELGHTAEASFNDSENTPRSLREAEAEAVALLLCESLELPGAEYARGYIQHWNKSDAIPEKSAQRIFGSADRILRAGREE